MPVDTSIYQSLLQPPKSLIGYANEMDQADLAQAQLAQQKLNLIGAQQDYQDQQKLRQLYAQPGFDPNKPENLPSIFAVSPKAGAAAQKAMYDAQKTQAETANQNASADKHKAETAGLTYDQAVKRRNDHLQQLVTVSDVPGAVSWINDAVKSGELPTQQAQQVIQGLQSGQVPVNEWKQKAMLGGLTLQQQQQAQLQQQQQAETARHNKTEEGLTARGQNMTAETANKNRVAENLRAGYDANGNLLDLGLGGTPAPATPGAAPGAAPAAPVSPMKGLVDAVGTYQSPESVALARVPPALKSQVLAAVKQQYPEYDPANYAERQATARAFAPSGKNGMAVKSFNVGLAHLDQLENVAQALDNGDNQTINKIGNAIKTWSGGTAPTNFAATKKVVMDETVKAIVGTGGGVGDREAMEKIISDAQSPAQLKGAIQQVRGLMGGQLIGLEQSYRAGSGGKKDFRDKYLSPEAQRAYDSLQQPSAASGPTGFVITHVDGKAVK